LKINMKNIRLGFFLASKSILRSNISSTLMIVLIMTVVFVNLLFTDSIFAGITKAMNQNKIDYQFGEIIIEPKAGDDFISNVSEIKNLFKDREGVRVISSDLKDGIIFINEKNKDGRDEERIPGILMGWDVLEKKEKIPFDFKNKIIDGRWFEKGDVDKIVIGSGLSGAYGVSVFPDDLGGTKPGDKIKVSFGKASKEYEVIGIYKTKNFDVDRRAVIPKKELAKILGLNNNYASEIIFRLNDKNKSKEILEEFKKTKYYDKNAFDWNDKLLLGQSISKSFEAIGAILRIIGSLVAGLVIFIIIFVDIVNRRRQIGILKSMGISQKPIILSYILKGLFYGFSGVFLAILFMNFVLIPNMKIDMPMADVRLYVKESALVMSIIFFLFATLLGSFVPAWREIKKSILSLLYH